MPPQARRNPQRKPDSPGMRIEVDGQTYTIREADLTPHDVRALRKETGFSFVGLARELQSDPDIDLIAALVWLARRCAGEVVSYDTVLDEMGYDSEIDVSVEDKRTKADDSPEA